MASHNILLTFIFIFLLPVLVNVFLHPKGREIETPTCLLASRSAKTAPLTLKFTVWIGPHSIPVSGWQLKDGPVFEARRVPSSSRLLPSSFLDWLRDALPKLLPLHVERWLRHAFPVWFLPTRFIVKEFNPAAPDSFYREGKTYATLQHLQGRTIPMHYAIAEIEHPGETETHKAHLLELVNGIPLSECTWEQSMELRSKEKIDRALALLSEKNIVQGDPWPRHYIHTPEGDLRIIDFGEAFEAKNADSLNRGDALNAMYWFSLQFSHIASGPQRGQNISETNSKYRKIRNPEKRKFFGDGRVVC